LILKGIVLAGGQSRRYGTDKALALWEGKTFLERSLELLDKLGLEPEVIANADKDYGFLGRRVHNDLIPGRGPLGGLHTAYTLFPERDFLVLSCDMPLLNREVLNLLVERNRTSCGSVVFKSGGLLQPFPGVYAGGLCAWVIKCLEQQRSGLVDLLSHAPDLIALTFPVDPIAMSNVNTPEDHRSIE
jgi:molybdopterin-guanine dinucleotide biosynthesis protein A